MAPGAKHQIELKIPTYEYQQPEFNDQASGEHYPAKIRKLPACSVTIIWATETHYRPIPFEIPGMSYHATSNSKKSSIKVVTGTRSYRFWPPLDQKQKVDKQHKDKVAELGDCDKSDPKRFEFIRIAAPTFGG